MLHEKARGDHEDGIDILSDKKGPKNTNMIVCFSLFSYRAFPCWNRCEPLRTFAYRHTGTISTFVAAGGDPPKVLYCTVH